MQTFVWVFAIGQFQPFGLDNQSFNSPSSVRVTLFFTAIPNAKLRSDLVITLYEEDATLEFVLDGQSNRRSITSDWKCHRLCGQEAGPVYYMLNGEAWIIMQVCQVSHSVKRSSLDSWLLSTDFGFQVQLVWRQRLQITVPELPSLKVPSLIDK
jgi:hypothetical protein